MKNSIYNNKCFIIAEAGVNHNGHVELAYKLVDAAVEAGVDCVKFQTYITENDTAYNCEKADYQKEETESESQYDMVKKLELSFEDFRGLKKYCEEKGIMFLSSPFDLDSLKFLDSIDCPFWKIASSEVTNFPLLREMGRTKKPIILSTGMCDLVEIAEALTVLKTYGATDITILHCNTEYPTPYEDVNLNAMETLKKEFGYPVGYSDHTLGTTIPLVAATKGAVIVEKHFTLDKGMDGPDHKASLEPEELKEMVSMIRTMESALGRNEKVITNSESKNRIAARKSIVADCAIKKGEVFSEGNLAAKRPGGGISPMKWESVVGKTADRDYYRDEMIQI